MLSYGNVGQGGGNVAESDRDGEDVEAKRVRRADEWCAGHGAHRKGLITLRSHHVPTLTLPAVDERVIRTTREKLHMSRAAFARRLGVNPRTLERWEQGARQAERSGGGADSAGSEVPRHAVAALHNL
jgi:DNA-binding transcriptional regulator YiaG